MTVSLASPPRDVVAADVAARSVSGVTSPPRHAVAVLGHQAERGPGRSPAQPTVEAVSFDTAAPTRPAAPDTTGVEESARPSSGGPLVDGFGRVQRDLRVSVTDRCPLRCAYCVPAEGVPGLPAARLLTGDEIVRAVDVATGLGVDRVRLTGGEPLLRGDLVEIVAGIAGLPQAPEVSLTTSGVGLARSAGALARAGLRRVNVSLDSTDRDHYARLARRDRLDDVLAGLEAARAAGLAPIKLNAVVLRGVNEDDVVDLLEYAGAHGFELRFIEHMPFAAGRRWRRDELVTAADILGRLSAGHRLTPLARTGPAPATRWLVDGGPATIGLIAAVTRPFCGSCDRLRLTADGQLRHCLFARTETDLRAVLRSGGSDSAVAEAFRSCVAAKPRGHGIGQQGFTPPDRPMSAIGG